MEEDVIIVSNSKTLTVAMEGEKISVAASVDCLSLLLKPALGAAGKLEAPPHLLPPSLFLTPSISW